MVPLSVTEGAAKEASGLFNMKTFMIAGAIAAVLVGVIVVFQLLPKNSEGKATTKPKKAQVVQQTVRKAQPKEVTKKSDTATQVALQPIEKVSQPRLEKKKDNASIQKEPEPEVVMVEWPTNEITRAFDRDIEFRMAQYINAGQRPSPPPPMTQTNLDEMAKEALAKNIVVRDDDTEALYATKEGVAKMKEELRQYMAQGGTATAFFKGLADRQKSESDMAMEAGAIIAELSKQGQIEEAKKALTEINAILSEHGQPAVIVPPPYRKALGILPKVETD